jgi:hypothetical protein
VAYLREEGEGKRRGRWGLFVGAVKHRNRQGVKRIEEGMLGVISRVIFIERKKETVTWCRGTHLSVRKGRKEGYRFGKGLLGHGPLLAPGQKVSHGPFLKIFFFSSFSFSVFYFFHNFCKFGPN